MSIIQKLPTKYDVSVFDKNWGFFYETPFSKIFRNSKYSLLLGYLLVIIFWLLIAFFVDKMYSFSSLILDWWLYCVCFCFVIGTAILFLEFAKRAMRDSFKHFLYIANDRDQPKLMSEIMLIGDKKKQFILCGTFGLITFVLMLMLMSSQPSDSLDLKSANLLRAFAAISSGIAALVSGVGLWVAVTSMKMIRHFHALPSLKLDFINPAQTEGITKLSSLMGYYATLFCLQVLAWEIPYAYTVWTAGSRFLFLTPAWMHNNYAFFLASSVFGFFLVGLLIYFVYPQIQIVSLVDNHKKHVLCGIQHKIKKIYTECEVLGKDEASLIGYYLSLYKEIENHKGSLPVQNLLGFSASFVTSFMLSLAGSLSSLFKMP